MTATSAVTRPLTQLNFDNSYARLRGAFHAPAVPRPLLDPELVHFNIDVAALLDLDPSEQTRTELIRFCGGADQLPGSCPVAMAYAGHQFGQFVPSLGDGRALLLGEVVNAAGERWDLHLKGCGPTRFARGFDGRSVLRSAVREYLGGEALHALAIPTTRALAVVGSSEPVTRERLEPAATLLRVAPSHIRFGTFEWFTARGDLTGLRHLADYVILRHFPQWGQLAERYVLLLREAVVRTASLVAHWQAAGFTHGVLNTDNMSILGLTLDFGPYGFMEAYRHAFVPNRSDQLGRYAFNRQPGIAHWNLSVLAAALAPLLPPEAADEALSGFGATYADTLGRLFRAKLGLRDSFDGDDTLVADLLAMMEATGADFTLTFRALGGVTQSADSRGVIGLIRDRDRCTPWLQQYRARLARESSSDAERRLRMDAVNPVYVLRNWLAQRAVTSAERGEFGELARLLRVLRQPFVEQPGRALYASPAPADVQSLAVSCSS